MAETYTVIFRWKLFALWLALCHIYELLGGPIKKLPLDFTVLSPKGQVVWRVATIGKAVDVSSQSNEGSHQVQVLKVHCQM